MSDSVEVRQPIDWDRLRIAVADVETLTLDEVLTDEEYQALSELLERHPKVTLSAHGFSKELAAADFLRWFPRLRRFNAYLRHLTDAAKLNSLPEDLEWLNLLGTQKPLDLRPLKFAQLRELMVVGHHRGLSELVNRNHDLRALALHRLKIDQVLPEVDLPNLESLALSLGSLSDPAWLAQFPKLRYLAIRQVRGVADLEPVNGLSTLEWLWLDTLSGVTHMPDLSANTALVRADIYEMRNMVEANALAGLAAAPNLDEVHITSSRLPVEAFEGLAKHPRLSAISVGTGNVRRNKEIDALLDRPRPRDLWRFARDKKIRLVM